VCREVLALLFQVGRQVRTAERSDQRADKPKQEIFHVDSLAPSGITLSRMNVTDIISSIDAEIATLEHVRNVLTGTGGGTRAKKPTKPLRKKRRLSAAARGKIAAAQKKRWAAAKRAAK